jgi:hypothetical protein
MSILLFPKSESINQYTVKYPSSEPRNKHRVSDQTSFRCASRSRSTLALILFSSSTICLSVAIATKVVQREMIMTFGTIPIKSTKYELSHAWISIKDSYRLYRHKDKVNEITISRRINGLERACTQCSKFRCTCEQRKHNAAERIFFTYPAE